MNLFDLEDLASFLKRDLDRASATVARTMATGIIRAYTKQNLVTDNYEVILPWDPRGFVTLPQRPVTAVASLEAGEETLPTTSWLWPGYGTKVWLLDYSVSLSEPVTVAYTAGHAIVPSDLFAVALTIAARLYENPRGLSSRSIDDYSESTAEDELTKTEKMILANYRKSAGSTVLA